MLQEKDQIHCRLTEKHKLFRNSHLELSNTEFLHFCIDFTIRHSERGIKDQIEHHNREISRLHNELDRISEIGKRISQMQGGIDTVDLSKDEVYLRKMIDRFKEKEKQVSDRPFILWAEDRVKEIKQRLVWLKGIDNDLFRISLLNESIWQYFYRR